MGVDYMDHNTGYVPPSSEKIYLRHQSELTDLVRDLNLSKNKAELLSSRLQCFNHQSKTKNAYQLLHFLVTVKNNL
jgi:hypothetical protein